MSTTFKAALTVVSSYDSLTDSDRAYLRRLAADDWPDDPVWERIAVAARAHDLVPRDSIHSEVIWYALLARRHAESVKHGSDPELRERQKQHDDLLVLARHAEALAHYFKWAEGYSGIANFFERSLMPVQDLREFHQKEAQLLRQRAGRKPIPIVRIRRQDRSKNQKGLRRLSAFMDMMNYYFEVEICGKPNHHAVAVLADRAFPGHDVDAEYVRKALLPTTNEARRRKSRALDDKKS